MLAQAVLGVLLWGAVADGFVVEKAGCEEGATYPHPDSCRIFSKCIGGKLVAKFCPIGEVFDQESSCLEGNSCDLSKCNEGEIRPSSSPRAFKICRSSRWVESKCPPFHKYNQEVHKCILDNENSYQHISKCVEGQRKLISCTKYLSCEDGEQIVRGCALGEVFNEEAGKCVEGACNRRSKRNVFACEEGHKIRKEGECKKYLECVNGNYIENSCSDCMNFDDESRTCRIVFNTPCTSPAPPVPTDPTQPTTSPTTSTSSPTTTPTATTPPPKSSTNPPPQPSSTELSTSHSAEPSTTEIPPSPSHQPSPTELPPSPSLEPSTSPTPNSLPSSQKPSSEQPTSTPPECSGKERRAIKGDCSHYYECNKGKFEKNACILTHFDSRDLTCSLFSYVCA